MQLGLAGIVIIAICLVIVAVIALPTLNTMFANQTWMKVSLAMERTIRWQSFLVTMAFIIGGLLVAGVFGLLAYFHKTTIIAQAPAPPQIVESKVIHIHLGPGQDGPAILAALILQGQVKKEDADRVVFSQGGQLAGGSVALIEGN